MRNSSFIEIYDNALSKKECDILINQFENSSKFKGLTSHDGVLIANDEIKKCQELHECYFENNNRIAHLIQPNLVRCIKRYAEKYKSLNFITQWKYDNNYNFQKYETEDDGFKVWHCEHGIKEDSHRILAWMFYLNNAHSGTEFMNFSTIRARMGRCVIWPAGWTHLHKGVIPNKGLKYIVTGWCSFKEEN